VSAGRRGKAPEAERGQDAAQPERAVPDIKFRPGVYAPGREAVTQILEAALDILISEGIRSLTLRRIAAACDLRVGNVTYYFATKDELLRAVLDVVMAGYRDALGELRKRTDEAPEQRLALMIRILLEDIQSQATTNLFPELWALANHDPFVADCVNDIYRRGREVLLELIAELNPSLDAHERETVAVFVHAAIEGMTIFAGHNKPFSDRMPMIESISVKAIVDLVRTIDSKTIRAGIRQPLWRRN
jgi:AcrR family transcriptional regulator